MELCCCNVTHLGNADEHLGVSPASISSGVGSPRKNNIVAVSRESLYSTAVHEEDDEEDDDAGRIRSSNGPLERVRSSNSNSSSRRRRNMSRTDEVCWLCGQRGHDAADCPVPPDGSYRRDPAR